MGFACETGLQSALGNGGAGIPHRLLPAIRHFSGAQQGRKQQGTSSEPPFSHGGLGAVTARLFVDGGKHLPKEGFHNIDVVGH